MTISIARRAATFAILGATALLVACSSGVKLDDVDGANSNFGSQPWNDPKSPLFEKSVYFGFDEYTVQTKYQKMLRDGRMDMTKRGIYDPAMMSVLKKARCSVDKANFECSLGSE